MNKLVETKTIKGETLENYVEENNLNWVAKSSPIYTGENIGGILTEPNLVSSHQAIVREDTGKILNVANDSYNIIQNEELYAIASAIPNVEWEKIREIDGGQKLIIEGFIGEKNDKENLKKIKLQNSFDGSLTFGAEFCLWRQVCSNGMYGWKRDTKISIRHSKNSGDRIRNAQMILSQSEQAFEYLNNFRIRMQQKRADKKLVENFLNNLYDVKPKKEISSRMKNQMEQIEDLFHSGKGNKGNTVWDLYNGATEFFQHSGKNKDKQLKSNLIGFAKRKSEEALKVAMSLV